MDFNYLITNFKLLKEFVKQSGAVDHYGNGLDTLLMYQAREGSIKGIKFLIKNGANINLKGNHGNTALAHACITYLNNVYFDKETTKNRFLVAKYLILKGADVNIKNNMGDTILISAARSGLLNIIDLMIKNNALLDIQNNVGDTALMAAVKNNQLKVIKKLINAGCNVNIKNNETFPLNFAIMNCDDIIINELINDHTNINIIDSEKNTPLHYAIMRRKVNIVIKLINYGANPFIKNDLGMDMVALNIANFKNSFFNKLFGQYSKAVQIFNHVKYYSGLYNKLTFGNTNNFKKFKNSIEYKNKIYILFLISKYHKKTKYKFANGNYKDIIIYHIIPNLLS